MRMFQIFLLFVAQDAFAGRTNPMGAPELRRYQHCRDSSNCVRVTNGCCDCANGGDTTAINRTYDKQFERLFTCDKTMCSQKAGNCKSASQRASAATASSAPTRTAFPGTPSLARSRARSPND